MKYSLFIGKWQPFHKGHKWLIEERLKLGKNVLIGIRDTAHDRKRYPKSPRDVKMQVFQLFPNEVNDDVYAHHLLQKSSFYFYNSLI